jgi:hypothetical protein
MLACATGMRSQDHGFVAQIVASTMRPVSFFETDWTNSGRLAYLNIEDTCSHLAVIATGEFRVLDSATGTEKWRLEKAEVPGLLDDFDSDADKDEIVLSTGVVVDGNETGTRLDKNKARPGFRPPQASGRSRPSQFERMLAARCWLRAKNEKDPRWRVGPVGCQGESSRWGR